jgi:hypothetical protein
VSDEQAIEGGGFKVSFWRLADRYAHRIEWALGGAGYALESLEGTSDEDWPSSPPLQELHFERREPGIQLALLVGRAGVSHWSASIELDPAAATLTFDVACRVRSAPERLGSSYRLRNAAIDASKASGGGIEMQGALQLRCVASADEGGCNIAIQGDALQIQATSLAPPWPKTSRWRYVLSFRNR